MIGEVGYGQKIVLSCPYFNVLSNGIGKIILNIHIK
jgi:hypothetical protein